MKADVKQFGRGRKAPDVRKRAGRVDLRAEAENELDAQILAMLYRVLFGILVKRQSRLRLYRFLREEMEGPEDFWDIDEDGNIEVDVGETVK